jgi:hypothetical protein
MNNLTAYDPWDLAEYDAHTSHVAAYNAEQFAPTVTQRRVTPRPITPRFTATRSLAQQQAIDSNNTDLQLYAANTFTSYHEGE